MHRGVYSAKNDRESVKYEDGGDDGECLQGECWGLGVGEGVGDSKEEQRNGDTICRVC